MTLAAGRPLAVRLAPAAPFELAAGRSGLGAASGHAVRSPAPARSTSSSTSATPSALMRASRAPSTSGVSSTLCSASMSSSWVRCPFSRPGRQRGVEVDLRHPGGKRVDLHRDEHRDRCPSAGTVSCSLVDDASPTRRSPAPSQPGHPSFGSRSISHATNRSAALRTEPGSSSSSSQCRTCAVTAAPALP